LNILVGSGWDDVVAEAGFLSAEDSEFLLSDGRLRETAECVVCRIEWHLVVVYSGEGSLSHT